MHHSRHDRLSWHRPPLPEESQMSVSNVHELPESWTRPRVDRSTRPDDSLASVAPLSERRAHERAAAPRGGRHRRPVLSMQEHVDRLHTARHEAVAGPGIEATTRQHERGKLTARERLDALLDADTFVELDLFARHRSVALGLADH